MFCCLDNSKFCCFENSKFCCLENSKFCGLENSLFSLKSLIMAINLYSINACF